QDFLPAVATGISFDFGHFFLGMALPFFGVLGAFIGVIVTMIANPLLYAAGFLPSWKKGMTTVQIMFANHVDFYLSFGIGLGLAVAAIGIWQCIHSVRDRRSGNSLDAPGATAAPVVINRNRGDIRPWLIVVV